MEISTSQNGTKNDTSYVTVKYEYTIHYMVWNSTIAPIVLQSLLQVMEQSFGVRKVENLIVHSYFCGDSWKRSWKKRMNLNVNLRQGIKT